jgi:alkylation response protein AidB-like acyl-CoA dehydrogenase
MLFELDEELRLLQASALRLARERFAAKAAHWDRSAEPPLENLKPLAEAGLAGITIDEAWGGSGASILHAVVAMEQIARVCPVTSAFILANCTAAELIQQFGTPAQQARYLPPLAAGQTVGCWAMTEPGAGSDAGEMTTRAVVDGGEFVLTGTKCSTSPSRASATSRARRRSPSSSSSEATPVCASAVTTCTWGCAAAPRRR